MPGKLENKYDKVKVGDVFTWLTVVSDTFRVGDRWKVMCRCKCGNEVMTDAKRLLSTKKPHKSCGCYQAANRKPKIKKEKSKIVKEPLIDKIKLGDIYGFLFVVEAPVRSSGKRWHAKVSCRCGTTKYVECYSLLGENPSRSCGCWRESQIKATITHGETGTPLHGRWKAILSRCHSKGSKSYKNYGGRGIKICDEWRNDYTKFRDWALANGFAEHLEIDRIDVNGNYEPGNCRWITRAENSNNKRNTVLITAFEETKSISEWAKDSRCVISNAALRGRVKRNRRLNTWTNEEMITTKLLRPQ